MLKANNFDVLCHVIFLSYGAAVLSHLPFHAATAFSKCHFSLACAIFLQDLDPCLAYKASSGYLLSFALNISSEKRQEVKELIELKNRPRSVSRNVK